MEARSGPTNPAALQQYLGGANRLVKVAINGQVSATL